MPSSCLKFCWNENLHRILPYSHTYSVLIFIMHSSSEQNCPLCDVPIKHPSLKQEASFIRKLNVSVTEKALQRLRHEGMYHCEEVHIHDRSSPYTMELNKVLTHKWTLWGLLRSRSLIKNLHFSRKERLVSPKETTLCKNINFCLKRNAQPQPGICS